MTTALRVAHLAAPIRLEQGGVVRAVLDMAGALAAKGHDIAIATWDATDVPKHWNHGRASVPRIVLIDPPGTLGKATPKAAETLTRLFRSADAVHLHTPWEPVNTHAAAICRSLGTPYILSIHGMLDEWSLAQSALKKRIYLALTARKMLERAHAVHCTAEAELTQSRRHYPKGNPVVVPLVMDLEPYRNLPGPELARQAFNIDPSRPTVLFLSRMHHKKGVHILLSAAALLRERNITPQLLIAGTGDEEYTARIQEQIRELNLGDQARLLGMVKGLEKISLYQAADVFALPTSQENFGFVLPEALACATPAITTKGVDTWPELEASGSTLIAEQTPEAFAQAIAALLGDPDRRDRMGEAGRRWVLSALDPDTVARRYADLYAAAARSRAP